MLEKKSETNTWWLKYVHIRKLNNNRVGKNINPKLNTPK
jgi:hypothetical protein